MMNFVHEESFAIELDEYQAAPNKKAVLWAKRHDNFLIGFIAQNQNTWITNSWVIFGHYNANFSEINGLWYSQNPADRMIGAWTSRKPNRWEFCLWFNSGAQTFDNYCFMESQI
jgi:hypothetical protein